MFVDLWDNFFTWSSLFLEFGRQVYDIVTMSLADFISTCGNVFPIFSLMTEPFSKLVEFLADDMSLIDLMFGPVGVVFVLYSSILIWCAKLVFKFT